MKPYHYYQPNSEVHPNGVDSFYPLNPLHSPSLYGKVKEKFRKGHHYELPHRKWHSDEMSRHRQRDRCARRSHPDRGLRLSARRRTGHSSQRTEKIDRSAFRNCRHLESVTLPGSLKTYESPAMYHNQTVVIPDGVTTLNQATPPTNTMEGFADEFGDLGPLIFATCKALRSVAVPSGVQISENLFSFYPEENEKAMNKLRITYVD